MKRRFLILICVLVSALLLLSSCAGNADTEGKTLWVVTEESFADGMNWQTQNIIAEFKKANPDVKVTLEILPDENKQAQEREIRLKKIRSDILAGQGPDIYLLPNSTFASNPLFEDVQQSMYNGVFADISAYYDADDGLGKEELVTEVMDGGVVDGARYVLPLFYTFPVLYTERQLMTSLGLDLEASSSNIYSLLGALTSAYDTKWNWAPSAAGYSGYAPYLPQMIDYASGKVVVGEEELSNFLSSCCSLYSDALVSGFGMSTYINTGRAFEEENPIYMGWAQNAVAFSAISKVSNQDLVAIPIRAADGDLVACVTYYGAVGNGCSNPELAYQLLREFLTEDVQFEKERLSQTKFTAQTAASGLPVRSRENVSQLWQVQRKIYKNFGSETEAIRRKRALMAVTLEQTDVPVLDVCIDRVHFANSFDQQIMTFAVADILREQADMDTVVKELILQLQMHAAEG